MSIYKQKAIPYWVWTFSIITLFLCILSSTDSDIFYVTENYSFWASWANNLMGFSYTYEIFYIMAVALFYIIKNNNNYENRVRAVSELIKQIVLYSVFLIAGIFIINLVAYTYASIINGEQITFLNNWTSEGLASYKITPIMTGVVMSVLMLLRLILTGFVITVISLLFNKRTHIGFTIVCLGLVFIGFNTVTALRNINIFPFQYGGSDSQEIICKDNVTQLTPISLEGAIVYFICLIILVTGIIMLVLKYKSPSGMVSSGNANTLFRQDMGRLVRAKHVWLILIILAGVLPFLYYCVWLPESEKLDSAYAIFTNAFAYGYLLNCLLPLLSVAVIGFVMWRDVRAMIDAGCLTGKKYLQKVLVTSLSAGIVVVVAAFGAVAISLLIAPNTDWNWGFTALFMLRLFITASIFAAIGFGILALTNCETAAMAISVLYTQYALGGVYHIAGVRNIDIFQIIMPKIMVNEVMESISAGYTNIISAAIVAIVLLIIGYTRIRKKVNCV